MYQPINNIKTPSIIPTDNIIHDRNNDILYAINNYEYPSNNFKLLLKINTNKLNNNKYLVHKYTNQETKATQYEIHQKEFESIIDLASRNNSIRIEYITESLNSNNDMNNNYYELSSDDKLSRSQNDKNCFK